MPRKPCVLASVPYASADAMAGALPLRAAPNRRRDALGTQIPILNYPFGGPMGQSTIEIVGPELNLP